MADQQLVHTSLTGLCVYGESFPSALSFDPDAFRAHVDWLVANTGDPDSAFQRFIRSYFGQASEKHFKKSLNRFAMSVELTLRHCPPAGVWFDAGSIGHDALRVKLLRPDIRMRLAVFEGCIIVLDGRGLHYHIEVTRSGPGTGQIPEPSVHCEKIDFEREPLNVEAGTVDLVTSYEVLEHYKFTPVKFMLEANRILRLGGKLVISTPNACSAQALGQMLRGLHPAECSLYHRSADYGRIHPLEYARAQLAGLLEAYGFDTEFLASVNLTPFEPDELTAIEHLDQFRGRVATTEPLEVGQKWIAVARKMRDVTEISYPPQVFE